MTAENTEPNDAPDGDDLRARYLPVSRKELRRRREAGITEAPVEKPAAEATSAEPDLGADARSSTSPAFTTGSESTGGPGPSAAPTVPWEFSLSDDDAADPAVAAADPAVAAADPAVAAADADRPDARVAADAELLGTEEDELPEDRAEADPTEDVAADASPVSAGTAPGAAPEAESAAARTLDTSSTLPRDLPDTERDDDEDAPVPASRKSRRGLGAAESVTVLSEFQELNQALSATDDPNRVDPELLKKQQALAARAMQANQERLRKEQVEADRDAKERRRRLRPESEVITRKTLRAHMESDEPMEPTDYATGSIEPIQARGAHGLEIDAMVEHSTRQGARQSMMGWLVIILAVLLIIAVGVVLSFIL